MTAPRSTIRDEATMLSKSIRCLVPALLLLNSVGCEYLGRFKPKGNDTLLPSGPVREVTSEELLSYLNTQSANLQAVQYPDVYIDVYSGKQHFTLGDSSLVCAKPRNFLMVGGKGLIGEIVHVGSNDREFWMYSRLPEKNYVFCSHDDFQQGIAQLPFPFDPDWALQALGMASYPPTAGFKVTTDQRTREHTLSYETTTPQGMAIVKQVVLAADQAFGQQPQIKRHLVSDRSGRTIASAEIKSVATLQSGVEAQTQKPVYVQVPTDVQLEWPQQQMRLRLRLKNPKINVPYGPVEMRELFTKPQIDGVNPINLAQAQYVPSSYRGVAPSRGFNR
jgi:hypothetical protein